MRLYGGTLRDIRNTTISNIETSIKICIGSTQKHESWMFNENLQASFNGIFDLGDETHESTTYGFDTNVDIHAHMDTGWV